MTEKRYTHNILGSVFKDGEVFALTEGESQATTLCIELNELHEEKETYKRLFNEMAYYFRDNIKSLNDLDHKDFESLHLLAQGEYFDEESLCWCKVQLEELE